jgi:hypothetical protein
MRVMGNRPHRPRASLLAVALLSLLLVLAGCQANTGQWQSLSLPFPTGDTIIVSMTPDPHVPQLVYAGTSNGQVLRLRIESLGAVPGAGLPANAAVSAILTDAQRAGHVLAGTSQGIYQSTDYGDSWHALGAGLPHDDGIDALATATASHTLYAGTEQHGVYLSHDGGATWAAATNGLPAGANVYGLTVDPATSTVYAALVGHGVYASTDGAQTWTARDGAPIAQSDAFVVLALPRAGANATLLAGTSQGLFTSADQGQTWQPAGLNTTRVIALFPDPTSATTIYAGTASAGDTTGTVYRSTDSGAHWTVLAPGLSHAVAAIVVLPDSHNHNQSVVFAASGMVLRYPGLGGATSGGPLGTVVTIALFLGVLLIMYWVLRRSRRKLLGPVPATRPTSGAAGSTAAPPLVPPEAQPRRTTATGQVIPARDTLAEPVPNPWSGEPAEGGNGSAARHPELN